jgi:Fur family transcriptional regulator, ferric uptake regulator
MPTTAQGFVSTVTKTGTDPSDGESTVAISVATALPLPYSGVMASEQAPPSLRDEIRKTGLRATASRIAVLRELRRAKRPVSHGDVVEMLAGEPWDRATLYRNLIDLANCGLARKVELGDRVWRFDGSQQEHAHDATLHPHFVCTACGSVECLPQVSISRGKQGELPRAIVSKQVEVHVRGLCDTCFA